LKLDPEGKKGPPGDFSPPTTLTGPDGGFQLTGVPAEVSLELEVDDASSAYRAFALELPEPKEEARRDLGEIHLEPGTRLVVSLADSEEQPIEGAMVRVDPEGSAPANESLSLSPLYAEEKAPGEYVLERLAAGACDVEAFARGFAPE